MMRSKRANFHFAHQKHLVSFGLINKDVVFFHSKESRHIWLTIQNSRRPSGGEDHHWMDLF